MNYDVVIIGAGPAGLFAAYELSLNSKLKVLVVDKGKDINQRKDVLSGVGGAGLFSDGKLNLTPVHGKTNLFEFLPRKDAYNLIQRIDDIFIKFGAPKKYYTEADGKAKKLKEKAKKHGIELLLLKQKHIGSDRLKILMGRFVDFLKKNDIKFMLNCDVNEFIIKNNKIIGIKTTRGIIKSDYIISCPGRVGSKWMIEQTKKLGISIKHRGIEVGVRVEVPANVMKKVTDIIWDPPFFIKTKKYKDRVRTFCTCPYGFIAKETYHGFIGVNGYCRTDKKSKNTNFALLSNTELTHPATDTIAYGESIGTLGTTIAGGTPFIQRFSDLINYRRSYWNRIKKCD
ncbi:MAG: FAD-dependent oxidoreductase [Candidatus Woesearchaeota archaeon]